MDARRLDTVLLHGVDNGAVAGVVAMVATPHDVIYEGAFGRGNIDAGLPMACDTVFWISSLTKALTATACMQLVEQGRVGLDQHVAEILPKLASPLVLEGFDEAGKPRLRPVRGFITTRHLLTHTAGFGYEIWNARLARYAALTGLSSMGSGLNAAFEAPLASDPGERWEYGIGIDWLGKLVEAISSQSLEIYFRENIFAPLGMTDSGFLISSAQRQRVATLFVRQEDGGLAPAPFEMPQRPEFFMGGGGAFSTPRDYVRFLRVLLGGGALGGARILAAETVIAMFTNQIGDLCVEKMPTANPYYANSFDLFPGQCHKWGLSFDLNEEPGPNGRSAGSASWAGLLNCHYWIDPARKICAAMFTQTLPFFDEAVMQLYETFERSVYGAHSNP